MTDHQIAVLLDSISVVFSAAAIAIVVVLILVLKGGGRR